MPTVWRAALYLRLSREDGEREGTSESIRNQRDYLTRYAAEQGLPLCGEYVDDGWTGTNFDRPGFQQLLRAIETGDVNAVLTKDLSRLGRDYILTGHYVERWFPEHGVRFIAVNDGIDTGKAELSNDMTPFKSVLNDLYARDISQKVRSALNTKKAGGKFIGANAPYGYRKHPEDHNCLVPDEETAKNVRTIFRLFLAGESLRGVARRMDSLGVPPPGAARGCTLWNDATVRRILTNPTYIGNLTQNRSRKVSYKVKKRVPLPREEWVIAHNAHEALVIKKDFEAVQALLQKRARHARGNRAEPYPLAGLVFCGVCGAPMTLSRQGERRYLICSAWKRSGGRGCSGSRCIRADAVLGTVLAELRRAAAGITAEELATAQQAQASSKHGERALAALRIEDEENRRAALGLYLDKIRGIVPEEDYITLANSLRQTAQGLAERIRRQEALCHGAQERCSEAATQLLNFKELPHGALAVLVERVVVGEGKSLTIRFAFSRPQAKTE